MKVSVLGAGSWGTALAMHLGRGGHDVLLWSRDPAVSEAIRATGLHPRRFPGALFPPGIRASSDIREALAHSNTVLVAVPCASYRPLLESFPGTEARRFVSTAKGIEPETLRRMSQIILEYQPGAEVAALSGPTFAEGVARGDPSAAVIADAGGTLARDIQGEFSNTQLRLYRSDDLQGVELAGALKNVVAIAAGIVAGLGFGANTIAALVTRGLAELGRIVKAGGGQARTVVGLAGIGDLMLTCTGKESRNRRVGEAIGRGRRLRDVLVEMPEVAEGARTCLAVPRMAAAAGIEAPIADAVVSVLYEGVPAGVAVEKLMTRTLREE
jgi:glycerol-3-phosphate dehydrogenase (NAD(P)+)